MEAKIHSAKKENLYTHYVWTLGYVGLSLIITVVGVGHVCIAICFLVDAAVIYYGKNEITMTNLKKIYCSSLVATALLAIAAGQFDVLAGPFKMHILTTLTAPLYIIHRRNKSNVLVELVWVLGWLLLKCGITWIAAFQYFNIAGKMYSDFLERSRCQRLDILAQVRSPFPGIRRQSGVPVGLLDPVGSIGEERGRLAISIEFRRPPDMIEVQMGENQIGHPLRIDTDTANRTP